MSELLTGPFNFWISVDDNGVPHLARTYCADGLYVEAKELSRVTADSQMLDRLQALDGFIELTEKLDEHPDNYDGPCMCALCRSYT